MESLLDQISQTGTRQSVNEAVADAWNCGADQGLDADAETLGAASNDHDRFAEDAAQLDVDQLPDGTTLRDTLAAAMRYSQQADDRYRDWTENLQQVCQSGPATDDSNSQEADQLSEQSLAEIRDFVAAWNEFANQNGRQTYDETEL